MSIWQNRIAFKNSFSLPSHGQLKRRNKNSKPFTSQQQQDPYKQNVVTSLKVKPAVNLGPKVKNKSSVKKYMQLKCEENINDETEINVEAIKEMEFSDDSDIETLRSAPLSSEWTDIDHETLKEIKNLKYIVNSASVSDHLEYDMLNSSCKFFKSSTPYEVSHTISANELDLLPADISPIQRLDPWGKKHQNEVEETPEPNKKSDFSSIRTIKDVRRFRKSQRQRNAPTYTSPACTARRELTKTIKDNLKGTKPDYSNENRVLKVFCGNSDGCFSVAQRKKKMLKIHTSKKETVATRALPQDSDDCWNARSSIELQLNNDNSDLLEDQVVSKKVIKPKAQFTSSEKNKLCAYEMGLASNLGKINRKKSKFPVDSLIIRKSKKNLKLPKTTEQLSVEFFADDYSCNYNTGIVDKISEKKYLLRSTTISQSDENTKQIEVHFSHEFIQEQNDLKEESNCSAMNTHCAKNKPEECGTAASHKMTSNEFIPQGQNDIACSEKNVALNSCLTSTPLYPKNRGINCMPNISEIHKPAYSDLFQTISHEMVSESTGEIFEEMTEKQSKPCLSMQKYPICCIATLTDFPIVHYPIPIQKVFNVPPFLDAYEIDILATKF